MTKGPSNEQVGGRMSLSKSTVTSYVRQVRSKLPADNKTDLTRREADSGGAGLSAGRAALAAGRDPGGCPRDDPRRRRRTGSATCRRTGRTVTTQRGGGGGAPAPPRGPAGRGGGGGRRRPAAPPAPTAPSPRG
ncbi:LuxR C-terminal-related transcriptional regulator, partial [Micromonospora sp. NPDC048935]|uniref:LuxR C-terminal-related transcriptional regulator n=1 Tax=Micromonospora sp. NPDC048935 TaxID=3364262 RepID=UPI0037227D7E